MQLVILKASTEALLDKESYHTVSDRISLTANMNGPPQKRYTYCRVVINVGIFIRQSGRKRSKTAQIGTQKNNNNN